MASSNEVIGRDRARYDAPPAAGADDPSAVRRPFPPGIRFAARLLGWADRLESLLVGTVLGASLLLVVVTIVLRYVSPVHAPRITDEVTVYMVMWAVLLACGGVTARREHVKADLVTSLMSPKAQRLSEIAGQVIGIGFCLLLAWYAGQVTYEAWDFGDLSPTNLRFPLWIYYAALPLAALSMAVRHLIVLASLLAGRSAATDGEVS